MADVLLGLFGAFGGRGLKPISVTPCPILRRSAKGCRTITGSGVLAVTKNTVSAYTLSLTTRSTSSSSSLDRGQPRCRLRARVHTGERSKKIAEFSSVARARAWRCR